MEQMALGNGVYTFCLENNDEPVRWEGGFGYNHELVEARIPDGAKRIADNAFRFCAALERIIMPKSIEYLGDKILYAVTGPVEIHYDGTPKQFAALAEPRYEKDMVQVPGKYDVQPFCNTDGTYYREETVTREFDGFCADCRVIFPDGRILYYGYRNTKKREENLAVIEADEAP